MDSKGAQMRGDTKLFLIIIIVVVVLVGGAFYFGKSQNKESQANDNLSNGTSVESKSDSADANSNETPEYKEKLAKFLTTKGAVLYGAYWCPHCKDQKALFGDAVKYINYVECDAAGENANPDECTAKGVKSYPTWIYQGQSTTGTKSLSELAAMVGFDQPGGQPTDAENQSLPADNTNQDAAAQ